MKSKRFDRTGEWSWTRAELSPLESRLLFSGQTMLAPSDLTGVAASTIQVDLNWRDNSSNESGFHIMRSMDGKSFFKLAEVGADATAFKDIALDAGFTYYYCIRATDGTNVSADSNIISVAVPQTTVPEAPSNLTVKLIQGTGKYKKYLSAQINWTDNADNEWRFVLQRSMDGVNWVTWDINAADDTSYTDPAIQRGQTYYYRVMAYNGAGQSDWSEVATLKV